MTFPSLTVVAILVAAADDNDIRTHVPAAAFECAHARSFCFDETGRRLICITQRGELLVWNGNAEHPVVITLEKPGGGGFDRAPMSAVLANKGQDVVVFYRDGRAQVWSVNGGVKTKELESDRQNFIRACLSPDGELVACLSFRGEGQTSAILLWNTRDWTNAGRIGSAERINDFCFTPDGRNVLACVGHPTDQKHLGFTGIVAWNLASQEEVGRIEYGSGFPGRIAVSPDGRWVATGGGDAILFGGSGRRLSGHLRIFDWERTTFVAEPYTLETVYVRAVRFSPDSKRLYSGSYSVPPGGGEYIAGLRAFRVGDWVAEWNATLGNGNPHELSVSPNGKDLLVPTGGYLEVVDAKDGISRGAKLAFRSYPEDRAAAAGDPLGK
jgi:WD40 repeat protein